jgi:hypothetical protein
MVAQVMCMLPLSIQAVYMILAFLRAPGSVPFIGDERIAAEKKGEGINFQPLVRREGKMFLYRETKSWLRRWFFVLNFSSPKLN